MLGYDAEALYQNPLLIREIIHPDFADYFREKWAELLAGKVSPTYEYKTIDAAGQERWIMQSNAGVFDNQGNIIAIEGICRDVTERKRMEELLHEREARYRALFEQASELEQYRGKPFETVNIHRDGTRIPIEVTTSMAEREGAELSVERLTALDYRCHCANQNTRREDSGRAD